MSPLRPVYEGTARHLSVETLGGRIGIWPRHADLVAALGVGPLKVVGSDGAEERWAVRGGFLKVGSNKVTILVDRAVAPADVDEAEARRDLDEAIAALRHPAGDEEFATLLDDRAWGQARLKLAR